jgi:membrane peptidoglycan carboxypeptidase
VLWSLWTFLRRLVKTAVVLLFSVTIVPASMVSLGLAIVLFTPVPVTIPERKAKPQIQPSQVFDANGNLITVFRKLDANLNVSGKDIPLVLRHAVVAAEDRRFYTHNGVDAVGLARALRRDVKEGEAQQGGSTITQQLVKGVYYPDASTSDSSKNEVSKNLDRVWRKLRIAVIANRLDRARTKDEILVEYLSNIFLGNGAYGVGAASQTYFRKSVKDLTLSEAATLAGIIPAPSKYEPRGNVRNAEFKRKATLGQMRRERFITAEQFDSAIAQELWVDPGDGTTAPAGRPVTIVFGPTTVATRFPYFVDYVRRYLVARYGEAVVYGGGLTIQTTLDPRVQDAAESTAAGVLKGTPANLELSIVSVEPLTGFVKALVGGRDFAIDQVNLGLGNCPDPASIKRILRGDTPKLAPTCTGRDGLDGGGSGRSPGSSIKPIVLAAAFQENIPPTQIISGAAYRDPRCAKRAKCTTIGNYEGAAYGAVDLRRATIKSVNTAYARLGYDLVGIENVAKMAQKLGITSAWYDPRKHGPSYSLGGIDVSPLEMAAAYSVFAGRGKRAPVTPVLTVTDAEGKVLEDNLSRAPKQVISQRVADNVTNVLQGVVEEGTGTKAKLADRAVAGKTGTSQDYGNAWFVGYTPTLSTAVWMGYKDRPRPLRNIRGIGRVAGGTIPAATWSKYMKLALEGVPPSLFDEPAPIVRPVRRSFVEEKKLKARGGIDLGPRRSVTGTPVSRYLQTAEDPSAVEPAREPDAAAPPTQRTSPPSTVVTVLTPAEPAVVATTLAPTDVGGDVISGAVVP